MRQVRAAPGHALMATDQPERTYDYFRHYDSYSFRLKQAKDNKRLVSKAFGRSVVMSANGTPGSLRAVYGVAVSPDGRRAVSASLDKTLKVWDLEVGASVATFTCDASAECCAFAGARSIVTGDSVGRVHFLELMEKS